MGPNNLCYVTHHFLFFPHFRHVTFYKTLMSLSTVFIKAHIGLLQLLKWPCRTSFFTHVEPSNLFGVTKKVPPPPCTKNTQKVPKIWIFIHFALWSAARRSAVLSFRPTLWLIRQIWPQIFSKCLRSILPHVPHMSSFPHFRHHIPAIFDFQATFMISSGSNKWSQNDLEMSPCQNYPICLPTHRTGPNYHMLSCMIRHFVFWSNFNA